MSNADFKNDVKATAAEAKDSVKETAASLAQTGREALGAAGEELKDLAASARETAATTARARAEDGRDMLADQTQRFADGLRKTSYGADQNSIQGRLVNTFADGIVDISDELRDRSVASIWRDAQSLAHKHPGAFAAGAGILGFAMARFLMASEDRSAPQAIAPPNRSPAPRIASPAVQPGGPRRTAGDRS